MANPEAPHADHFAVRPAGLMDKLQKVRYDVNAVNEGDTSLRKNMGGVSLMRSRCC